MCPAGRRERVRSSARWEEVVGEGRRRGINDFEMGASRWEIGVAMPRKEANGRQEANS